MLNSDIIGNNVRLKRQKSKLRKYIYPPFLPSVDKDTHGFDGQKNAHAASKSLAIHKVLPADFSLPERFSAPAKLLAPDSDGFLCDFWFLRRRRAVARQGEKDKKHRKDTLSGVCALVN